ncbi:MAG: outer membrane protein [Campylobacterota bacterium]|nr:outer membrane protein [Campylobacterota bacterium]
MKHKIHIFLLFCAVLNAQESELLSQEKQKLLNEQKNEYEAASQKLKYNWIAPLNIGASYSYDKSANDTYGDVKKAGASISQDIYRSGGIESQVAYANEYKNANSIKLKKDIASLNLDLYTAILNHKKIEYELEQSNIKLKNHDIEIFIKQKLYEAGKSDITELNNALMSRIAEQKIYTTLEYNLKKQRIEIAKISDIDLRGFEIGSFELVDKDEYVKNSLDILYDNAQRKIYAHLYDTTKSSYLPYVSINTQAGYMDYTPRGSSLSYGYDGSYYSAGVSVNIPLTYNASYVKEEARASYMKQLHITNDDIRAKEAIYKQSKELIQSYKNHIAITQKNINFYDEIIKVLEAQVQSGTKSKYDLDTLKNTRAIEEYNIRINELDIETELSKLYFSINTRKDKR